MLQKMHVMGFKFFNDMVEGKKYNSTTLRIEIPVPRNSKSEFGTDRIEVKWGEADNAEKIKHLKFPGDYELDVEMTSKGLECFDFKVPVSGVKAA